MSNIDKLLKGVEVEWKPLGDVTSYEQPTNYLVKSTNYKNNFPIPVLTAGKTFILGYTNETNGIYKASENPIIIFDDFTTANKWVNFDFKAKSSAMKLITSKDETKVLLRYIYHWLNTLPNGLVDGDHKRQWISNYSNKRIPIPCPDNPEKSLEIQKEIVRILDKFSTLTAELQAELQARKSQYEYYRNQLLTYPMEESDQPSLRSSRSATSIQKGDNPTQPLSTSNPHTGNSVLQPHNKMEWKTLGEVVLPTSNIRWKNTNKSYRYIDLTSVCRDNNTIIETIEINKESAPSRAQKLVLKNDVIFATTRPTQQRLCLIPEEYDGEVASSGYCVLRANMDLVLPKWIYFWITSNKFKNYVEENQSGSAYPAISDAKVKEFKIPIPYPNDIKKSLEEQKRIITILDKFETLTTSITEGLPKEIELRQKQYEYYRDMLLTFPTDNIKA